MTELPLPENLEHHLIIKVDDRDKYAVHIIPEGITLEEYQSSVSQLFSARMDLINALIHSSTTKEMRSAIVDMSKWASSRGLNVSLRRRSTNNFTGTVAQALFLTTGIMI